MTEPVASRPQRLAAEHPSPRLFSLMVLVVAGLWAAVLGGRPELVVLVAPLAAVLIGGVFLHRWPDLAVSIDGPARCVRGDQIDLTITVTSRTGVPWLHLQLDLPPDLECDEGASHALLQLAPKHRSTFTVPVTATRMGMTMPGRLTILARDRFGLFVASQVVQPQRRIRVHPPDGRRRAVVAPSPLQRRVGVHGSRAIAGGTDFAEVRPWRPGDPARSVNWRVSARRQARWVTARHPDRSGDLVLLVDTFRDLGPDGDRLVERALRATLALADASLDVHDRVGVLHLGRRIRWYRPGLGRLHQARLTDALLDIAVEPGLQAPRVEDLPLHELGDGALIVALTGLLDPDAAQLPLELRARGHQVAVIELEADGHLPAADQNTALAQRLWRVQRAALAHRLRRGGVTVVPWKAGQELEQVVAVLARRDRDRRPGRVPTR